MRRKCAICRKPYDSSILTKIKNGHICANCALSLSAGVKSSLSELTDTQIKQIQKNIRKYKDDRIEWVRLAGLIVCADAIVLNSREYPLSNILRVKLNFHPSEIGNEPETAKGTISAVIEVKNPHFLIEEMVSFEIATARYVISGMDVTYYIKNGERIEHAVRAAQQAINDRSFVIQEAVDEYERLRIKAEAERKRQREERKKRFSSDNQEKELTPLEVALKMFGLERPFTMEELKRHRRQYLKEHNVHPDSGGNNAEFRMLEEAYEILQKFASN